jgi:hypothetical protein
MLSNADMNGFKMDELRIHPAMDLLAELIDLFRNPKISYKRNRSFLPPPLHLSPFIPNFRTDKKSQYSALS